MGFCLSYGIPPWCRKLFPPVPLCRGVPDGPWRMVGWRDGFPCAWLTVPPGSSPSLVLAELAGRRAWNGRYVERCPARWWSRSWSCFLWSASLVLRCPQFLLGPGGFSCLWMQNGCPSVKCDLDRNHDSMTRDHEGHYLSWCMHACMHACWSIVVIFQTRLPCVYPFMRGAYSSQPSVVRSLPSWSRYFLVFIFLLFILLQALCTSA